MGGIIPILNKNAININCYLRNIIQYKFHKPIIIKNPHLKKRGGYIKTKKKHIIN